MSDKPERRIILEVLTPESVKRLEARDDELREEITNLNKSNFRSSQDNL